MEVILTAKSQRTPFKTTLNGSEDWNIIVNTMKRWKAEDYDRFFVRIDYKFESITASAAAKDARLQPCLVNLDPLTSNTPPPSDQSTQLTERGSIPHKRSSENNIEPPQGEIEKKKNM